MSKHLTQWQIRGLEKMGDVFVPGDSELASFSASGCASEVDRILDYMPASDLKDIKLLFGLMALMPMFLVGWFLAFLERSPRMGKWMGPSLRFIRIGIRGLILTLYYSHTQAHKVLGYQVGVYTDDLRAKTGASLSQETATRSPVSLSTPDQRSF